MNLFRLSTVVLLAATIVLSWVIVRLVGWGARID